MLKHLLAAAIAFTVCGSSFAQSPSDAAPAPRTFRVVVKPAKPFAFEEEGRLKGYSIDLWERLARESEINYTTTVVATVPELLQALQDGKADVGVGAISITPDREKILDFSHPFFESGLQVLARSSGDSGAFSAFKALLSADVGKVCLVLLLAILVISHILWVVERKINAESFPEGYVSGIWESAWWSISTLISGGCENKSPVGVAGRLVAVVWMLGGIALTSYITATLASAMTVNTLSAEINGLSDLKGSPVATLAGGAAEALLTRSGYQVVPFKTLDEAVEALEKRKVRGVVYDSPMLRYYLATHPGAKLDIVGPLFDLQDYGFALPLGSPSRKLINAALLKLQVDGFKDELENTWFPSSPQ